MHIKESGVGIIDVVKGRQVIRMSAAHRVYAQHDLIDCGMFDLIADSCEFENQGEISILDCSTPRLHRYKDGSEFLIASLPEESAVIEEYFRHYQPKPSDIVFDLGAYCGVSAYHFAKRVAKVIAYEPDPTSFRCLVSNVDGHSLENVQCLQLAVSAFNGFASFNSEGSMGAALTEILPDRELGRRVEVPTANLETLVNRYGIPALIKMDIEGAELDVLRSSRELLRGLDKTGFAVDTAHYIGGAHTTERVIKVFRECGYNVESSNSGIVTTWAWKN